MARRPRELTPYASIVDFFGGELRTMRTDAGLSQPQLAAALGCTATWIGKIETAECPPSEATARDLDTYFKTNGYFWRLWNLIKETGKALALPHWFPQLVDLEREATSRQSFEAQVIPGLLQTESYVRAQMALWHTPEVVEARVTARMERQAIHRRSKPPRMWFVVDESALRRPVGGKAVMRDQLEHLITVMTEWAHVEVRILPFVAVNYASIDGSFTLLNFEDRPDVGYHEGPEVSQVIEDPAIVAEYAMRFNHLMGEALSRAESLNMVKRALEDYS
ncbi:helix-turn-helix domain-containing protein [Thermomonospora cellulosilytica]|uniref:Transcriptional regulator with XRE-family HTH domain n=1 Tax=Thermomonospora cellulosilytica TaxID=1411118 RepID=A0A7W3MZZ3_9ACTN|nr:helix-turn-helix transcriptional regulator [Thermomonospora cellulosilytica]MBA9005005.1 transcriptional regulator with XRE-family HTH domain [Thermomonospora cellulosilytica]